MKATKPRLVDQTTSAQSRALPEGMRRLSEFIAETMRLQQLTINTVSHNSNPDDPNNRIDPSTVWRIRDGKNNNVEDRTLILLARGLGVTPDTLRKVYLGTVEVNNRVRPIELEAELWERLEQSALQNRRVIRTSEGALPDYNNELATLLDEHLPPLRKRKAS